MEGPWAEGEDEFVKPTVCTAESLSVLQHPEGRG